MRDDPLGVRWSLRGKWWSGDQRGQVEMGSSVLYQGDKFLGHPYVLRRDFCEELGPVGPFSCVDSFEVD